MAHLAGDPAGVRSRRDGELVEDEGRARRAWGRRHGQGRPMRFWAMSRFHGKDMDASAPRR